MAVQQRDKRLGFKTVQLLKDQILGIGSYGKVCKAECDGLLCAAKVIHETLFDPTAQQLIAPQREHRLPMRRFEQECEFLSTIRHPNIIQYLCMYQDPDTRLPVLLMELMDDSLTHFLESSPQPIPYHIQVNICHDISLALSFLHSNGIVHRDLSSNNVLMIGNIRAKVTDFGMAWLGDMNPRATHLTFTMCPGTDVYMPPEAVKDKPVYTEKIDCFSFGVIAVQIMTRLFPQPGDRRKEIEIEHVGLVEKRTSEHERRQNHINKIDPNHPLLAISLDCLNDKDIERPSAEELCRCVASLKRNHKYVESVMEGEEQSHEFAQREESLQQQHAQQIEGLQQIIQSQVARLEDKDQTILQKDENIATRLQEMKEQHRKQIEDERSQKEDEILKLITTISELESQLSKKVQPQVQQSTASRVAEGKVNIKLKWRKGKKAPCGINNAYIGEMAAAVDGNSLYVMARHSIYSYNASTLAWSQLPDSSFENCALAIVNNLFTRIGGYRRQHLDITNKLLSLTIRGGVAKWAEEFPPIPTKRCGACALCTGTALIVAGGEGGPGFGKVATTEVLNTATLQWSTVVDLPQPTFCGSLVQINSDTIFMLGVYDKDNRPIKSMYTCSLNALLQSCSPQSLGARLARSLSQSKVWRRVANIPAIGSAYVSLRGQLLAVGGKDSDGKHIAAVYIYNPSNNSWEVISHMATPRYQCYAAVLPDDQLIVVGGYIDSGVNTDAVEIAISLK